jgi:hypothetical protein
MPGGPTTTVRPGLIDARSASTCIGAQEGVGGSAGGTDLDMGGKERGAACEGLRVRD